MSNPGAPIIAARKPRVSGVGDGRRNVDSLPRQESFMTARAILACLLIGAAAQAQTSIPQDRSQKTTVIDFEDEVIGGGRLVPQVEHVDARVAARHVRLIRVPENFREKVLASSAKL
jgi:hypothetical protein